ncbi:hypothetical protein LguiB_014490 [Lonicera macranthoides]
MSCSRPCCAWPSSLLPALHRVALLPTFCRLPFRRAALCPSIRRAALTSHSSALLLVLPSSSTNLTTGSTTGAGLPVRSIRSRHAVAEAIISGTQASSCNKKRGVVTGKKTAAIVRTSGKSRVTYDPAVSGLPKEVRSRLVSDMSAFLKDRVPMLFPTFGKMPLSKRTMLFDYLSESYDIDHVDKALVTWIQKKVADRFKDWKYKIHKNWQAQGDSPIPVEFIHRPDQWEWLCNHFKAENFQITQIRASENKKAHSGVAQAFVLQAHDLKQKGDQAPHLTTYVEVYKKYDPDLAAAVQSARTVEVEKMMADLPPIDEALDCTSPASAPALILSYETQVSVLERAVGPSRGTRVRGLESGSAKLPRKRGPSSQIDSGTSIELVAEVAQLRANQAAINEQLQKERAEREMEKVDFERKLQAQIEYVIRAAGIQPPIPPSDGSSPYVVFVIEYCRCPETWITGTSNLDAHNLGLLAPVIQMPRNLDYWHQLYSAATTGTNLDLFTQFKDKLGYERTESGYTVLHVASHFGQLEAVNHILSLNQTLLLTRSDETWESALHLAARGGHSSVLRALIDCAKELPPSEERRGNQTILKVAKEEMLRFFNDKDHYTALHEAVRYHHVDIVKMLIKEDPDYSYDLVSSIEVDNLYGPLRFKMFVDLSTNCDETPLYLAARNGFYELVDVIVKNCKSPAFDGPNGKTALHGAVISNNKGRYLLLNLLLCS